jgi:hypothetical protein
VNDPSCDPFESPKLKVERAKRHTVDYLATLKTITDGDYIQLFAKLDPETRDRTLIGIHFAKPLPSDLRLAAADAIYNLRSALDQATCRCAVLAGKAPDGTYFPHGIDKAGFEASIAKKCKKIPESIRAAIATFEPYYGGHGYLFRALHDLNLIDKHTDLIQAHVALKRVSVTPGAGSLPQGKRTIWHRTEDGLEVVSGPAPAPTDINQNIEFTISVTFAEIDALRGKAVLHVLNQLCELVERTIGMMETECRVLRLIA